MKNYCAKCNKLSDVSVKSVKETYPVKGESITITSEVAICNTCGEKLFNHELDDKNLKSAYDAYKIKHNLLSPKEISDMRKKYQLSQRALGQLLDWGEITINRYENGAIQDPAHNEVLLFISETENMVEIFEKHKHLLSLTTRKKLEDTLKQLKDNEAKPSLKSALEDFVCADAALDEYSGFTKFDLDKTLAMILLIVEKANGVFATKLNKLMWYADFLYFKRFKKSISGCSYVHLPLGPVPNDYDLLTLIATEDNLITKEEYFFQNGMAGIKFKAVSTPDKDYFSKEEFQTIDFVVKHFKNYNCQKIKDKSHKEKAYIQTSQGEKISYKFASYLSLK